MSNNNIKEKKAARLAAEKQQDAKLYRLMIQFALVVVAVLFAIKAGNNQISTLYYVMPPYLLVTGILFALSAILFTLKKKNNSDESSKVITSALIFGNATALFGAGVMYYLYWDAKLVIASLITLTVLYFAHNIYGGNFFAYSLFTAAGYIALQVSKAEPHMYPFGEIGVIAAKVLSFAIPVAAIILGIMLISKNKNYSFAGITIGGKKCAVTFFICAAAILLGAILPIFAPSSAVAANFILLGSYLVIAVICTVKMI